MSYVNEKSQKYMPKRKSADDIRKQTSRICKTAVERLSVGLLNKIEFGRRIALITEIEKRYMENIHSTPQYLMEVRRNVRKADSTQYQRSVYMSNEQ